MNEKFFMLSKERQDQMIKAGYKVFATYPYKKAPMSTIAEAAGISKALLFHYFANKKGLYLYLLKRAQKVADEEVDMEGIKAERDFFVYLLKTFRREIRLMRAYPYMFQFLHMAYFETNPEVFQEIAKFKSDYMNQNHLGILRDIDRSHFKDPKAPELLLKWITLAVEGYMGNNVKSIDEGMEDAEKEIEAFIFSLRDNYYI